MVSLVLKGCQSACVVHSLMLRISKFLAQDNIFQLSDWFSKPMIWAIIVKFDQIMKNWWRILEVGKKFFAASSIKEMSRFEEVSPEDIKRIAWKFTKTVSLLGLAGYELIITNSAYGLVGYIYLLFHYCVILPYLVKRTRKIWDGNTL